MKYFFLAICCLFLVNDAYGQKTKKEKPLRFFSMQGSFFYDGTAPINHPSLNPAIRKGLSPKDYLGFNSFYFGWKKIENRRLSGWDLELMYFKVPRLERSPFLRINSFSIFDYERTKMAAEIDVYYTFAIGKNGKGHGLFIGPVLAWGVQYDQLGPNSSSSYPSLRRACLVGVGGKVDFFVSLWKRGSLLLGTKLILADFGYGDSRIANPQLPRRQQRNEFLGIEFFRPHVPLMMGLAFRLGK